jgi:hypothetical protein
MTRQLLILFLIGLSFNGISQNDNKLSVEFGYGYHMYSMDNVNEFYIDSFVNVISPKTPAKKITSGQSFYVKTQYQLNKYIDVGIYGSFQNGKTQSTWTFVETDNFGDTVEVYPSSNDFSTQSIGVGVTNSFYLSEFILSNDELKNKFRFGTELNLGWGFSRAIIDIRGEKIHDYDFSTSKDFQSQFGLKTEFDLIQQPFFITIGVRGGYQYYRTGILQDRLGENWDILDNDIHLDFSGLYVGGYIKLGK